MTPEQINAVLAAIHRTLDVLDTLLDVALPPPEYDDEPEPPEEVH